MPTSFFDPEGRYYETMTDIPVRDGHTVAPQRPRDGDYERVDGRWQKVERPVAEKRAAAFLTRAQFLKACVAARIITAEVAEEAASGQWPAEFDTFIAGLTSDQRIEAKATWADGGTVHRGNAILALIAADLGVSDAQIDAMFGIE